MFDWHLGLRYPWRYKVRFDQVYQQKEKRKKSLQDEEALAKWCERGASQGQFVVLGERERVRG